MILSIQESGNRCIIPIEGSKEQTSLLNLIFLLISIEIDKLCLPIVSPIFK